jgi:hypothetical protein
LGLAARILVEVGAPSTRPVISPVLVSRIRPSVV